MSDSSPRLEQKKCGEAEAAVGLSLPNVIGGNDGNSDIASEELSKENEANGDKLSEEEPIREPSEEEPSEGSMAQLSSNGGNDEEFLLNSVRSNSEEKKRLAETMADHFKKRQKLDLDSMPEPYAGSPATDLLDESKTLFTDGIIPKKQETTGSSGKKRRSRCDTEPGVDGEAVDDGDVAKKKRKVRWVIDDTQLKMLGPLQLPDFANSLVAGRDPDPKIQKLNTQLLEINRKLQAQEVIDVQPEAERSLSPLPIYDHLGIKICSREATLHAKLIDQRQKIISELVQMNPTFKPPPDYKPPKFCKKLYVPIKEYAGYNFIGLIIGPRGNTQKRMEKETGARILVRGRGSVKEGKAQENKDLIPDHSEDDDLNVLVEADSQKSLDAAVGMVEKLLVPVEEGINEHKHAQLRELAELNGTIRDDSSHGVKNTTFKIEAPCNVCGLEGHLTAACPSMASIPGRKTVGHHAKFHSKLRSRLAPCSSLPLPSITVPWMANPPSDALQSYNSKPNKENDDTNIFVGCLPQSFNAAGLAELFSPFGCLTEVRVIRDKNTGLSRGYGFVRFTDPIDAAKAVAQMNGHRIEGNMLSVRVGSRPPPILNTVQVGTRSFSPFRLHPSPAAIARAYPAPVGWPGPPGSILTEHHASLPMGNGFYFHPGHFNGQYPAPFETWGTERYLKML